MSELRKGATALVTGAASGIGLALSRELARRGLQVWMADIEYEKVRLAADPIGARSLSLDVRDAAAFRECVGIVVREAGCLDFLFNNAGILISGEASDFDTDRFDRIIDVNIRGVVNGTMAAYPVMIDQGFGHIVNTASLGGLMPAPLLAAYGMSKHAVVGLTTSLRFEAERHGVRVSAICPAGVDTPMLDESGADGLRLPARPDVRRYLSRLAGTPCAPEQVAREAIRGIERNQVLIVMPARARLTMFVYRFFPGLVEVIGKRFMAAEVRRIRADD